MNASEFSIRTRDLNLWYGTFQARYDVSVRIRPRLITSLIGPSGCGKTTLMNLIAGYEAPSRGAISLDGKPATAPGPDRLLVFQETALFPSMTTLENVMYGP